MPRTSKRAPLALVVRERQAVGRLSSRLVRPQTLKNYTEACRWFFALVAMWQVDLGDDWWQLDDVIVEAIEYAWETGKSRNLVGNLLSGMEHYCSFLRQQLKQSWRLWRVWGSYSQPCRAPPFTVESVMAVAHYMWDWGYRPAAILTCVAFSCFLRTMEFVGMQYNQLTFSPSGDRCHLALPRSKGVSRHGGVEGVAVDDALLVRLLRLVTADCNAGDFVIKLTAPQYRTIFDAAVAAVGLPATFKPYSLRRGGATWHFRLHGKMSVTMEVGRWSNMRTARTYVNTALMELTEMTDLVSPKVMQASQYFAAILARFAE